jgi:hypothetical protein
MGLIIRSGVFEVFTKNPDKQERPQRIEPWWPFSYQVWGSKNFALITLLHVSRIPLFSRSLSLEKLMPLLRTVRSRTQRLFMPTFLSLKHFASLR